MTNDMENLSCGDWPFVYPFWCSVCSSPLAMFYLLSLRNLYHLNSCIYCDKVVHNIPY